MKLLIYNQIIYIYLLIFIKYMQIRINGKLVKQPIKNDSIDLLI